MKTLKQKRKNIKFFKLITDDVFWFRFRNICLSAHRIKKFGECRINYKLPSKTSLRNFILEEYELLTGDKRDYREVLLDLLSEEK